ncbi:MAG: glycosyltransferase family protein [Gammaproteobacteria bacterium]
MKVVALIQARMGSERLPGKVLKPLHGYSVLNWVVSRVQRCKKIDQVVVATTSNQRDDKLVRACDELSVDSYRGSETNVLSRFYDAALQYKADVIVRVCCDCPLIDSNLIDLMIEKFICLNKIKKLEYLSNTLVRTFPRGLDAEIFSISALKKANDLAKESFEQEHVTPYIYLNPQIFSIEGYKNNVNYGNLRWTLDTEDDFTFLNALIGMVSTGNKLYLTTNELLAILERNPALIELNAHVRQKEIINT